MACVTFIFANSVDWTESNSSSKPLFNKVIPSEYLKAYLLSIGALKANSERKFI